MTNDEISKIIGEIFIQRNSVNLHLDVLDMPDFFWERYAMCCRSLEPGQA